MVRSRATPAKPQAKPPGKHRQEITEKRHLYKLHLAGSRGKRSCWRRGLILPSIRHLVLCRVNQKSALLFQGREILARRGYQFRGHVAKNISLDEFAIGRLPRLFFSKQNRLVRIAESVQVAAGHNLPICTRRTAIGEISFQLL